MFPKDENRAVASVICGAEAALGALVGLYGGLSATSQPHAPYFHFALLISHLKEHPPAPELCNFLPNRDGVDVGSSVLKASALFLQALTH
jgi:hypothetical protein